MPQNLLIHLSTNNLIQTETDDNKCCDSIEKLLNVLHAKKAEKSLTRIFVLGAFSRILTNHIKQGKLSKFDLDIIQ